MGIYIKDMRMPTNCDDCLLGCDCPHDQSIDGYKMQGGRPRTCPLIPVADVPPRWIPVTERLPKAWWPVLGFIKFLDKDEPPAQQVLWYLGNGHWREVWRGDMIENDVTHWMPVPEPPKEE